MSNKFTALTQLERDYDALIAKFKEIIPYLTDDWKDYSDSDLGMFLLKTMAAIKDMQAYHFDRQLLEMYLPTVTQRANLISLLQPIGYTLSSYKASQILISIHEDVIPYITKGMQFIIKDYSSSIIFTSLEPVSRTSSLTNYEQHPSYSDSESPHYHHRLFPLYQGELKSWPSTAADTYYINDSNITDTDGNTITSLDKANNGDLLAFPFSYENDKVAIDGSLYLTGGTDSHVLSEWECVDDFVNLSKEYEGADPTVYRLYVDRNNKTFIQFFNAAPILSHTENSVNFKINYLITQGLEGYVPENTELSSNDDPWSTAGVADTFTTIYSVVNRGADPETVEEAKTNAPNFARTLSRAVTIDDYKYIVADFMNKSAAYASWYAFAVAVIDKYTNDQQDVSLRIPNFDYNYKVLILPYAVQSGTSYLPSFYGAYPIDLVNDVDFIQSMRDYIETKRMVGIRCYYNEGVNEDEEPPVYFGAKKIRRVFVQISGISSYSDELKHELAKALSDLYPVNNEAFAQYVSYGEIVSVVLEICARYGIRVPITSISICVKEDATGLIPAGSVPSPGEFVTVDSQYPLNEMICFGGLLWGSWVE